MKEITKIKKKTDKKFKNMNFESFFDKVISNREKNSRPIEDPKINSIAVYRIYIEHFF